MLCCLDNLWNEDNWEHQGKKKPIHSIKKRRAEGFKYTYTYCFSHVSIAAIYQGSNAQHASPDHAEQKNEKGGKKFTIWCPSDGQEAGGVSHDRRRTSNPPLHKKISYLSWNQDNANFLTWWWSACPLAVHTIAQPPHEQVSLFLQASYSHRGREMGVPENRCSPRGTGMLCTRCSSSHV